MQALLTELAAERERGQGLEGEAEEARRLLASAKQRYAEVHERLQMEGLTSQDLGVS